MIVGIDATNIRSGGGVNHLKFILNNLINDTSIKRIILIHNERLKLKINNSKIIIKNPWYSKNTFLSLIFQIITHDKIFKSNNCDVLFIPGGIFLGKFTPLVSLSQNILPFSLNEIKEHKKPFFRLKLHLIRLLQIHTFNKSNGLIFLHKNAKKTISKFIHKIEKSTIIPHGIHKNEMNQLVGAPKKFLYVSDFHEYKNHKNLIKAFSQLIEEGYDIKLKLIGSFKGFSFKNLNTKNIEILGSIKHEEVLNHYKNSDAFIFTSSCENLPIAMLEAMSFGHPIISSNREPMISLLDSSNIFVDPIKINEIRDGIIRLINNKSIHEIKLANFEDSKKYNWETCSTQTVKFLIKNSSKV